jgi:hypothetical protein
MYEPTPLSGLDGCAGFEPGSSLFLADAGRATLADWLFALLADGLEANEGAVVVALDRPATAVLDTLDGGKHVCVIDCDGPDRTQRTLEDGTFVYSVASPGDLTGIGIGLTACIETLRAAGYDQSRVGLLSLTPVLEATGEEAAFKFGHVVASRLETAGFLGIFGLGQPHSPEAKRILMEAFDQTVELRATAAGVEGRVQHRRESPGAWQSLEPPR